MEDPDLSLPRAPRPLRPLGGCFLSAEGPRHKEPITRSEGRGEPSPQPGLEKRFSGPLPSQQGSGPEAVPPSSPLTRATATKQPLSRGSMALGAALALQQAGHAPPGASPPPCLASAPSQPQGPPHTPGGRGGARQGPALPWKPSPRPPGLPRHTRAHLSSPAVALGQQGVHRTGLCQGPHAWVLAPTLRPPLPGE